MTTNNVELYNNPFFGFLYMKSYTDRGSVKSLSWRKAVKDKDGNTCVKCGVKHGLCAHHIKEWKEYPSLRYDIDNGITLCRSCHMRHHKNRKGKGLGIEPWIKGKKGVFVSPWKGKKFSEEHKAKLSLRKIGKSTWNKGITGEKSHTFGKKMKHRGKTWIIDSETGKRKWIDKKLT